MNKREGFLMVLSGPSGSGKSTAIAAMQAQYRQYLPPIHFSVSATTRPQRPGEQNGVHYQFVSRNVFEELKKGGGLLEWAEYAGQYYGTPSAPVRHYIDEGHIVLLDIETYGALQVKKNHPDSLFVYLVPRSLSQLEKRLRGRGTETDESIAKRMQALDEQLQHLDIYDHIIFNNDNASDKAAFELAAIMAARCTRSNDNRSLIQK